MVPISLFSTSPDPQGISKDAKDIVAKLLTVDSAARLSAEQALQHPWVQGKCFGGAEAGEEQVGRGLKSVREGEGERGK